jgi:hypothetical protein
MFARITCATTALITAERCFCLIFPLHIKSVITPKRTTIIIIGIYIATWLTTVPTYATSYLAWVLHPDSNTTLLVQAYRNNHDVASQVLYFSHGLFSFLGFLTVLIFTLVLIYNLGKKSQWRHMAIADQEKAKSMSRRDRGTINMVVVIASILVVCYTPAVLLCMTTFLNPEFLFIGRLSNVYHSCWSFGHLFETINSSVNIFLNYKMSSKYRQTLISLFVKT